MVVEVLKGKKVAFFTLGCKLNFAETSTIGLRLEELGAERVRSAAQADLCVVNTCSVTEVADRKGRQLIHKLHKDNPYAVIAVTGCYAQLKPTVIQDIDGVEVVVGAINKSSFVDKILEHLNLSANLISSDSKDSNSQLSIPSFFSSCSRGDRTRYFLKVQDGCDYFCTYCTVPYARGRSRNGSIESIIKQAQAVADAGGKEIVITGVNTGDFGRSTGETFFQLIQQLDTITGIERYRISSIEPNLLTDEMIDFCASSRAFMPHFHIPLQSGSDTVLRLMQRRYTTDDFRRKIEKVHSVMTDAFIGIDVIVGMRGETDPLFEETYQFLNDLSFSQLHVFSYSERLNTKALEIPYAVPSTTKHERSQRLLALSEKKLHDFYSRFVGTQRPVLLEHSSQVQKPMNGFTDNYIKVEIENHPELDNHIVMARLGGFTDNGNLLCSLA